MNRSTISFHVFCQFSSISLSLLIRLFCVHVVFGKWMSSDEILWQASLFFGLVEAMNILDYVRCMLLCLLALWFFNGGF